MRRSQVSIYIIIGIILIAAVFSTIYLLNLNKRAELTHTAEPLELSSQNMQQAIENCAESSIFLANEEKGLAYNEEYESFLKSQLSICADTYIEVLEFQGYVTEKGNIEVEHELTDDAMIFTITYPLAAEKSGSTFKVNQFTQTIKRTNYEKIDGQTTVVSPDNKAKIVVPDSADIGSAGLKLIEKNFDGLANSIVVGNQVYEALPDGATFEEDVDISIELRSKDYPLHINLNQLVIAWWDDEAKIWKGLPTAAEKNILKAKTKHFTKFAVVYSCGGANEKATFYTPMLYRQKYSLIVDDAIETDELISCLTDEECEPPEYDLAEFCSAESSYWYTDNNDDTITPSKEEYLKYLDQESPRIDETVQEIEAEFTYGEQDSCFENPEVQLYCCCSTEGCKEDALSRLECIEEFREDALMFKNNYPDNFIECENVTLGKQKKEIKVGYNNENCIAGSTEPSNSEGYIFEIEFEKDGNSCIMEQESYEVVPVSYSTGEAVIGTSDCTIEYSDRITENGFAIDINSVETSTDSMCSECLAQIIVKGEGIKDITAYKQCSNPGSYALFDEDGLKCKICEDTPSGLYYTQEAELDNCLCSASTAGNGYCSGTLSRINGHKECVEVSKGEYVLKDWDDPSGLCGCCDIPLNERTGACLEVDCIDSPIGVGVI